MKIFVTGATGFIGQHLVKQLLKNNHKVICYTRNQMKAYNMFGDDIVALNENEFDVCGKKYLEGCDAVINLAGEPVAQRWTDTVKENIAESRIGITEKLVTKINSCTKKPQVLISASAVGYYGNAYENILVEDSEPGQGFLSDVCYDWEYAASNVDTRLVNLRIGVVLGRNGGALQKMLTPFKMCLGGKLGSGNQWMPWIHVEDIVSIILEAINNQSMEGPVNCVSPNAVTNKDFTNTLASVLSRPAIIPVPEFALKLLFGEGACILLDSQNVKPNTLLKNKFKFKYPDLKSALNNLLKQ
jgi:uncharacterized protein (TIGR01777 family)